MKAGHIPTAQTIMETQPYQNYLTIRAEIAKDIGEQSEPDLSPREIVRERKKFLWRKEHKRNSARSWEIKYGDWLTIEARLKGLNRSTVRQYVSRGGYPDLRIRKVNRRVWFVAV